jgi:hypothetical protein
VRTAPRTDEDRSVTELGKDAAASGRLLVESGEPVAGSMVRSAAAILFGEGPAPVRLAPELAACLRRAAADLVELPAGRERARAGAVLAFTVELAATRAAQGRQVRTDGFFAAEAGRSPAGALAEAVVLHARAEADEWRVRHLGYLLAETAVSSDLDLAVVDRALRITRGLTGRQIVLLAAVGRRERTPLPLAPLPLDPRGWRQWGAVEDVADLQRRGLLDPPPAVPRPGGAALPRLRMADLRLTRRGVLVHRLLALDFVREDAVAAALDDLALPHS